MFTIYKPTIWVLKPQLFFVVKKNNVFNFEKIKKSKETKTINTLVGVGVGALGNRARARHKKTQCRHHIKFTL